MDNLWGGRFAKGMDEIMSQFNASIEIDQRLYAYDIKGSIAHVQMLAKQAIISMAEAQEIIQGLNSIQEKIEKGDIVFSLADEDIHMAIEKRLIQAIGDTGRKLHTARSRNDQIALDMRLYLRDEVAILINLLLELERIILQKATKGKNTIWIGFTHLQHAQPITLGFYLLAYFQMFRRDIERLQDLQKRIDYCPLGACALAGTSLPIDRQETAKLLGFAEVTENALDTVSDRDYMLEFLSAAAISMMHLSRFAEEFILFASQEFNFIKLDDGFCTGSSIMPQKKNPDVAELIRGKTGRVYGDLQSLLTIMKGTPLAYNKDFQEDKEAVFDALDTWKSVLLIFSKMLETSQFNSENIKKHLEKGFLNATDIAEHLAMLGYPFRRAHEWVGKMVHYCEQKNMQLKDLKDQDLQEIDPVLKKAMLPDLDIEKSCELRKSYGGTAPSEVAKQIAAGEDWLNSIRG